MLKVLLFLFLYMLYGVLLTVFMVKFKIFDAHKEVKNDLNNTRDSLKEERFVSNYKFTRIKYYTDIAAKGNNIKFLRGWIHRVLKEK